MLGGLVEGEVAHDRPAGAEVAFQLSRDMRLVQFQAPRLTGPRLGLESGGMGGGVIDLNAFEPTLPKTMVEFLEQGEATLSVVRR